MVDEPVAHSKWPDRAHLPLPSPLSTFARREASVSRLVQDMEPAGPEEFSLWRGLSSALIFCLFLLMSLFIVLTSRLLDGAFLKSQKLKPRPRSGKKYYRKLRTELV